MPPGTNAADRLRRRGTACGLTLLVAGLLAACAPDRAAPEGQLRISSTDLAAERGQCLSDEALIEDANGVEQVTAPAFHLGPPNRVAVLPFAVQTGSKAGATTLELANAFQVTSTFRNHFTSLPFQDVEWEAIRTASQRLGVANDTADPRALILAARELNADAVLIGRVVRVDRIYALAVGQIAAEAELELVRLKDDCTLWRAHHVVRHNKGGIALSPIGLAMQAVQTALSLDEQAQIAAVDQLARELVKATPNPGGLKARQQAMLLTAQHSGRDGALSVGQTLKVSLAVDRSLARVTARAGDSLVVPMSERGAENGVYLYEGSHVVRAGENVDGVLVRYEGSDDLGGAIAFVDPSGPLTIDTLSPTAPTGLKSAFGDGRIRLSWQPVETSDLVAYDIERSATPLTGFERIGESELPRFEDRKPLKPVGYYRVLSRDRAGNRSAAGTPVAGRQIAPGPTTVSDRIDRDTTWYAAASPYVLQGETRVLRGATLTVEPGTTITLAGDARLIVQGRLLAEAGQNGRIAWQADADGAVWKGIVLEGSGAASRLAGNEFSGAETAVTVRSSDPVLRDNIFLRNRLALVVRDAADPDLQGNVFRNNRLAVRIDAADPVLSGNRFQHNEDAAVEVVGASPVIRGNSFQDNDGPAVRVRQQARSSILEASHNWWGSIAREKIAAAIDGAVSYEPVLDAPPPDGKAVASLDTPAPQPVQVAAAKATAEPVANPAVAMLEGLKLIEQGDAEAALRQLAPLEELAAENPSLQYTLSLLYFELAQPDKALVAIDRAIARNPATPNFHLSRAQILRSLDRKDEAHAALAKVIELQPGNRTALLLLNERSS